MSPQRFSIGNSSVAPSGTHVGRQPIRLSPRAATGAPLLLSPQSATCWGPSSRLLLPQTPPAPRCRQSCCCPTLPGLLQQHAAYQPLWHPPTPDNDFADHWPRRARLWCVRPCMRHLRSSATIQHSAKMLPEEGFPQSPGQTSLSCLIVIPLRLQQVRQLFPVRALALRSFPSAATGTKTPRLPQPVTRESAALSAHLRCLKTPGLQQRRLRKGFRTQQGLRGTLTKIGASRWRQ